MLSLILHLTLLGAPSAIDPEHDPSVLHYTKISAFGSVSRGNSNWEEVGGSGAYVHRLPPNHKFTAKSKSYYWSGGDYEAVSSDNSGRYDYCGFGRACPFAYLSAKTDGFKKVDKEFEESVGVSVPILKEQILIETKIGHRYTSNPNVDSNYLVQNTGVFFYHLVFDRFFVSYESTFEYPIYSGVDGKTFDIDDTRLWLRFHVDTPIVDWVKVFAECEDLYFSKVPEGAKRNDIFVRFGLDFIW